MADSSFTVHRSPFTVRSYAYCRRIVRRANSSFPLAFRLLPPDRRRAMDALYAFFRATDDLADEPGDVEAKRAALARWRTALAAALAGEPSHPIHPALRHTVETFGVPMQYLDDVLDGVEADLAPVRFPAFADLYPYCYRVASAVGLACLHVWGFDSEAAKEPAEAAGIAFQLTNILRDLGEDLAAGRVYLPEEDLARFGCPPESWRSLTPAFREMMRFQVARARDYYHRSEPLAGHLTPAGRAVFGLMAGTYRGLLAEIERRDSDVFTRRVRLARRRKLGLYLAAWPVRWGLW